MNKNYMQMIITMNVFNDIFQKMPEKYRKTMQYTNQFFEPIIFEKTIYNDVISKVIEERNNFINKNFGFKIDLHKSIYNNIKVMSERPKRGRVYEKLSDIDKKEKCYPSQSMVDITIDKFVLLNIDDYIIVFDNDITNGNVIKYVKKQLPHVSAKNFMSVGINKDKTQDFLKNHMVNDYLEMETTKIVQTTNTEKVELGNIYIIRTREYADKKEAIYKIGKTKQELHKRMSSYGKDVELYLSMCCNLLNLDITEQKLKEELCKIVKLRGDIGVEYFEGDINLIIDTTLKTMHSTGRWI